MIHSLYPCLWFDNQAREAADFYCSLFPGSRITAENPMVVRFELDGYPVMALNGGPHFSFTPSISFFVTSESNEEIDALWARLSEGGKIMMTLDKYDWSEYYGWCADKYGMTWQLYKGKMSEVNQKIVPLFLFSDSHFGQAEEAVKTWTRIFPQSSIEGILKYPPEAGPIAGTVMHSQFRLGNGVFMAMDGPGEHGFSFNEAVSLVAECDTQEEIDQLWNALTAGGKESMCGWLSDKYGVSWQVVPKILGKLMSDPAKAPAVVEKFMKMKKFEIAPLLAE